MCTWQQGYTVFFQMFFIYFWSRDSQHLFVSDSQYCKIQTTGLIMLFDQITLLFILIKTSNKMILGKKSLYIRQGCWFKKRIWIRSQRKSDWKRPFFGCTLIQAVEVKLLVLNGYLFSHFFGGVMSKLYCICILKKTFLTDFKIWIFIYHETYASKFCCIC